MPKISVTTKAKIATSVFMTIYPASKLIVEDILGTPWSEFLNNSRKFYEIKFKTIYEFDYYGLSVLTASQISPKVRNITPVFSFEISEDFKKYLKSKDYDEKSIDSFFEAAEDRYKSVLELVEQILSPENVKSLESDFNRKININIHITGGGQYGQNRNW